MRTLRVVLAGTVVLTLLGGLGAVAVAQPDDAEQVSLGLSPVTGTVTIVRWHEDDAESYGEDRSRYRGGLVEEVIEVDDPRMSGTVWSTWNFDTLPDPSGLVFGAGGALGTGSTEIVNDDGSWRGTFHGYKDPATFDWFIEYDLAGTGAYEGHSALLHVKGQGGRMDVDGFIFPGAWPEYPNPVELPAE
jgi:hypothetical protein